MAAKRFVLVVNPQGGIRQGMAVLEEVRPLFAAAGAELDVHVTQFAGHAAELARTLDLGGCDGFCVLGGDGTIHEAANGLFQRGDAPDRIPLGLIPGGTGNSLLLHLACTTVEQAVGRILAGATQPLDVARVTSAGQTVHCLNIVGWGGVVDINRTAERWRLLGRSRYTLATIWNIARPRRRRAKLVLDDRIIEDDFVFVLACNTRFTGKGLHAAPHADLADGKIDVVVVRHASRTQLLRVFQRVFDGSHLANPCVEYHQVRSFRIETDVPDLLNLDGELKGQAPIAVEMLPHALKVFA